MTEIKTYEGKCKCNKELDMRITEVNENENKPKSKIFAWIIYGFCTKCKTIFIYDIFPQEEKPVQDRDFIIDYNKKVEGTKNGTK
jgi:hypothetical protein